MASFMEEFEHLRIQLEEIKRATNSFRNKVIGAGGFGAVYKGEVLLSKGRSVVAIKRLSRQFGQGDREFLKEIMMLSRYRHQNLISLLGFCDEENEKVLVYEYAPKGSLDRHLSDPGLTWTQRIKICLGAAKGLSYLHDPNGAHQRVLHCDIKSANILLDENMIAKVADFGLSKMGSTNHQYSVLITNASGTPGYCDPLYMMTSTLTKESDVYSFGVVLFEVLCGKVCFQYINGQVNVVVPMWKQKFSENKIHEIVFQHDLMSRIHPTSLKIFSDIAFQCLYDSREGRPTMSMVVEKLEAALEYQELCDLDVLDRYMDMVMTAVPPLKFRSAEDLKVLFSNGVLLNAGLTWFSINDHGEHSEFISIAKCLIPEERDYNYFGSYNSRFPAGALKSACRFKTCLRPQFLTPHITYTVNLIFKFDLHDINTRQEHVIKPIHYKLEGQEDLVTVHIAYEREDKWWTAELCQFTSDGPTFSLHVSFSNSWDPEELIIEGIEFRPLEKVERQVSEDEKPEDMQLSILESLYDDETYWEQMLPNDYKYIIKKSKDKLQWTTKKELYSIFSKGFLIVNHRSVSQWLSKESGDEQWFSLDKTGKKCLALSPRSTCRRKDPYHNVGRIYEYNWEPSHEARFGEVMVSYGFWITILPQNRQHLLSPHTSYAIYLVYKLPEHTVRSNGGRVMKVFANACKERWNVLMDSPETPVVRRKVGENTHNPAARRPKVEDLPQQRSDGWMEVKLNEFQLDSAGKGVIPKLELSDWWGNGNFARMMIQCIEIRPI